MCLTGPHLEVMTLSSQDYFFIINNLNCFFIIFITSTQLIALQPWHMGRGKTYFTVWKHPIKFEFVQYLCFGYVLLLKKLA